MRVLVFARAPVPGRCKTRLIPRLGARGAAWVQRRLLERALATAAAAFGAEALTLCCAPDSRHPHFHACQRRWGLRLARQGPGDLGAKMRRALATGPALLLGSDAWALEPDDLRRAAAALADCDYLLIPAPDGGYGLIGARQPLPSLAGVAWSSGRERSQTLRRLRRAGRSLELGPARADFDTPGDWRRARRAGGLAPLVNKFHPERPQ